MNISACFISHKTSTLKEREAFRINKDELPAKIKLLQRIGGVAEAAIIITCNRIEFYCVDSQKQDMLQLVEKFYSPGADNKLKIDASKWQVRQGTSVARHLFKVTSGLDSAILGEYQILNQVKEAYSAACSVSTAGKYLHKLFHIAFQISKKIRGEFHFSDGASGYSGAAVNVLSSHAGINLADSHLTVIGINQLTENIIERMKDKVGGLTLVNRTGYKAEKIARVVGANAVTLSELPKVIGKTDILISMTSAQEYVVNMDTIADKDPGHNLLILDMAFPRDVDPEVNTRPDIQLLDLDDVKVHLTEVEQNRVELLPNALEQIEEKVLMFESWRSNILNGNHADLRAMMERDRVDMTNKFSGCFKEGEQKALEAFSKSLYKQLLRRINSDPAVSD